MNSFDVIVAGGGAAGLSAAIFLGRAKLSVALFDNGESSLYRVSRINNYLGFPEGVGGGELLDLGKRQTERSGAVVIALRIDSIRVGESGFEITAESENYRSTYFIVASNKRTDLAAALDLPLGGHGNRFVSVDADGRTRVANCFAVGRITGLPSQAVISAGDGAKTALAIIRQVRGTYYVDHDV